MNLAMVLSSLIQLFADAIISVMFSGRDALSVFYQTGPEAELPQHIQISYILTCPTFAICYGY